MGVELNPSGIYNNGHTVEVDIYGRIKSPRVGYMGPVFPLYIGDDTDPYLILEQNEIWNTRSNGAFEGSTGSYNAVFHGGFLQRYSTFDDVGYNWTQARMIIYCSPNSSSHDSQTVNLDVVKYYYSTNWQTTGLANVTTGIDSARGGRLIATGWFDIQGGTNGSDVSGMGIRNNAADGVRINAVYLQFRM